jgi:hypothetical protein
LKTTKNCAKSVTVALLECHLAQLEFSEGRVPRAPS